MNHPNEFANRLTQAELRARLTADQATIDRMLLECGWMVTERIRRFEYFYAQGMSVEEIFRHPVISNMEMQIDQFYKDIQNLQSELNARLHELNSTVQNPPLHHRGRD